jgi:hypothetical protein
VIGHRFSIGVELRDEKIVGCAIVGRPVARNTDQERIAEVTRLVTDGTKNACSMLYGAAARAAAAMGFDSIQTFTLKSEPGTSLVAAGWINEGETGGGDWNRESTRIAKSWLFDDYNTRSQPMEPKQKWVKLLRSVKET